MLVISFIRISRDFTLSPKQYDSGGIKHNVLHITTKGQPIYCRARQLNTKKLNMAKEFQFMFDNGKSHWVGPVHLEP